MRSDTFILAAEGAHKNGVLGSPIGWSTNATSTSGTELDWHLPAGPVGWHDTYSRMTFAISIAGVAGAPPSAWSLQARFEYKIPHTAGYQRQYPVWAPFDAFNIQGCVAEKAGWAGASHPVPLDGAYGIIADNTDGLATGVSVPLASSPITPITNRVTVMRTVTILGAGVRVALLPTITGGDSTTRIMGSAIAHGWSDR